MQAQVLVCKYAIKTREMIFTTEVCLDCIPTPAPERRVESGIETSSVSLAE